MKKIVLIIALLGFVTWGFCQNEDEFKPFSFWGIKQGINYSFVNFNPAVDQGITLGYTGGLVFNYRNERLFGLQMELNYTQKGWTDNLVITQNTYSRKMDYIEMPFLVQVLLGKRPNFKVYINLGTAFGYLLSEKEDVVYNDQYRLEYYEKDIENAFDYSAIGGLGTFFNTSIGAFQIGVRYQWTFTDLFDKSTKTQFNRSQNQLWNFSVSYFLFDSRK